MVRAAADASRRARHPMVDAAPISGDKILPPRACLPAPTGRPRIGFGLNILGLSVMGLRHG